MKKFLFNFLAKLRRIYLRQEVIVEFHIMWLLLIFAVLGVFGIWPLIKTIRAKDTLITRMVEVSKNLERNVLELEKTQNILKNSDKVLQSFTKYMPYDSGVEDFLIEFYPIASDNLYDVKKISVPKDSQIEGTYKAALIRMELKGPNDPNKLIKAIEGMKRLASVKSFRMVQRSTTNDLELVLSIYYKE